MNTRNMSEYLWKWEVKVLSPNICIGLAEKFVFSKKNTRKKTKKKTTDVFVYVLFVV